MTNQLSLETDSLIELARKNAPYIYHRWVSNQISKLTQQLNNLRSDYKYAPEDKKKEIVEKGKAVKAEIKKLQSAL